MKNNNNYRQTETAEISNVLLQDYCDVIQYGYTQSASDKEVGPKFLRITDIQNNPINWSEVPYCKISENDQKKYLLETGDIVIARTGASTGTNAIYDSKKMPESVFASYLIRLKLNEEFDPLYVYYFLQSPFYKEHIAGILGGSAQPNANAQQLTNVLITKLDPDYQRQIATILSSLDDKIELNRKMNKTLEEMGKTLFKRWFVDFEFPNGNGKPYKSGGGEMVESELGLIPEGWKIAKIKDFGGIVCGKTPPKSNHDFFGGDIPFIKIPDMHGKMFVNTTEDTLTKSGAVYQKSKTLPKGSICVSCIATVGLVCITVQESQTNQQINSIIPGKRQSTGYLYFLLSNMTKQLQDYASGGSATLNLNTRSFSSIPIVSPDDMLLVKFHQAVEPVLKQIMQKTIENEELSTLRDYLLPRLMSGKLRVTDKEN